MSFLSKLPGCKPFIKVLFLGETRLKQAAFNTMRLNEIINELMKTDTIDTKTKS